MNANTLDKGFITELQETNSLKTIDEYEELLRKEKQKIRVKKLIDNLFLEVLNSSPEKYSGTWMVSGAIIIRKDNIELPGTQSLSEENRSDLELLSEYLKSCGFDVNIYTQSKEVISITIKMTLQERDDLEFYLIGKHEDKVLSKVKYRK